LSYIEASPGWATRRDSAGWIADWSETIHRAGLTR